MDLYYEYLRKFNEEPLLIWGLNYNHPIYIKLLKTALKRGTPLTDEEIENAFKDVPSDIV